MMNEVFVGESRSVCIAPPRLSIRTSTSVNVAERPSIAYRLPGEPSIPPNAAAFDIGPLAKRRPRRRYILSAFGQFDVDREPQVFPPRGNLEKQIIGVGAGLAYFKIARPKFIREGKLRQQHRQNGKEKTEAIHRLAASAAFSRGASTTIS